MGRLITKRCGSSSLNTLNTYARRILQYFLNWRFCDDLRSPDEWVETILIVVVFTLNTIESSRCVGSVQIMPERPW